MSSLVRICKLPSNGLCLAFPFVEREYLLLSVSLCPFWDDVLGGGITDAKEWIWSNKLGYPSFSSECVGFFHRSPLCCVLTTFVLKIVVRVVGLRQGEPTCVWGIRTSVITPRIPNLQPFQSFHRSSGNYLFYFFVDSFSLPCGAHIITYVGNLFSAILCT